MTFLFVHRMPHTCTAWGLPSRHMMFVLRNIIEIKSLCCSKLNFDVAPTSSDHWVYIVLWYELLHNNAKISTLSQTWKGLLLVVILVDALRHRAGVAHLSYGRRLQLVSYHLQQLVISRHVRKLEIYLGISKREHSNLKVYERDRH